MEEAWHNFCKHVFFFAYNLRMDRDTVLILKWLPAQCQNLGLLAPNKQKNMRIIIQKS